MVIVNGALEPRDLPAPEPGAREALVRVRASALNSADLAHRTGAYTLPAPRTCLSRLPGWNSRAR
ncbi:MAG: hypothetical protein U0531_16030 [Dehalococcoidia bacterium]